MSEATGTPGSDGRETRRALLVTGVVLTQIVGLRLAVLLWYAGTRDAPPLGWQAIAAWVPIVGLWAVNRRWHLQWTVRNDGPPAAHP